MHRRVHPGARLRRSGGVVTLSLGLMLGSGCQRSPASGEYAGKKVVVCTTTMIADLAGQIGGGEVRVVGIMGPGMDPHIYDPTPDDSIWFRKADLVLVNGLHLEGRMLDMIESSGSKAVKLGEHPGIGLRRSAAAGAPDPHVWWNVAFFKLFAEGTRDALAQIDPEHADAYRQRAEAYLHKLDALDAFVRESIATIPASARYMITSHDAFYYYGQAYGLEVDAVLGISTDAQAKAGEQARLARITADRHVPAIFHETSVSAAQNELVDGIVRVAREKHGHEVRLAGPLYSDSLGEPGSESGTYLGAVMANTKMIVEALGGAPVTAELAFQAK